MRYFSLVVGFGCLLFAGLHPLSAAEVDFNRDIRPILSNHCFQCHGPDEDSRQAELRLDLRASATEDRDGGAAVVAGDATASRLLQRVTSDDADLLMPPPDFKKPLSSDQIEKLKSWIESGATYDEHWSFRPIRRPEPPPPVKYPVANAERQIEAERNAIDAFVRAELSRHQVLPSPPADRFTLIRRVYLDLLGLPPSIEQVDRFVQDDRSDAYERLLDEVLASPHFGERWGRHWLDQARYADSHGYTNDNERSIWPYRDWVINAFNRDLPFDQFTIEQLAGDLLDNATLDQKIATGFHRNTLINTEGGTKADQFRDEQVKDRVDTTGLVWMGMTVGCAKCHTHKFDPITQHEYYQLYAFFNHTADNNSVTPTVKVPSVEQNRQIEELSADLEQLKRAVDEDGDRERRRTLWEQQLMQAASGADKAEADPYNWQVLNLDAKSQHNSELKTLSDQSVLVVKGNGDKPDEYHCVTFDQISTVRSVKLEVLTDESLPKNGPGRAGNGNFVLSEFWFRTGDGRELRFQRAGAEHSQPNYPVAAAIDGKDDTGWAINGAPEGSLNRNRTAWFVLAEPLQVGDDSLTFKLLFDQKNYGIGRFRISVSDREWIDNPSANELAPLLALAASDRSKEQQQKLDQAFARQDELLGPLVRKIEQTEKRLDSVRRAIPTTMVLQELAKPRPTHVHVRGDFLRPSDQVRESVPAVLPPLPASEGRLTRLDFARWLMSDAHPLTARVRVNRIWMRSFGLGLVETENDFGIQGTLPTHPELLDWLASEFRERGWSQKQLIRLIMNSATYRQSSKARPELNSIDQRNLLLARQNRIRVEAEIVRDLALAVSGKLTTTIGGPGVYPPQEEGVYAFTQRTKNWATDDGKDRFRRGMYTYFYRSAPYPMLETFDVPKFNATCTARIRSNTPLQSLTVANSQAMFELAQAFGQRMLALDGNDGGRLVYGFRRAFARQPSPQELSVLENYLADSRQRFDDESESWTAVARLLMNLDEFITRE